MKLQNRELFDAIIFNNLEAAIDAINHGADSTFIDDIGNTPAHYAAGYGCIEILKLILMRNDFSIFEKINNYSNTPFLMAAQSRQINILHYLISEIGYKLSEFEDRKILDSEDGYIKEFIETLVSTQQVEERLHKLSN